VVRRVCGDMMPCSGVGQFCLILGLADKSWEELGETHCSDYL